MQLVKFVHLSHDLTLNDNKNLKPISLNHLRCGSQRDIITSVKRSGLILEKDIELELYPVTVC